MGKFIVVAIILMVCVTVVFAVQDINKSTSDRVRESSSSIDSAEKNLGSMVIDGKTYSVYNKE